MIIIIWKMREGSPRDNVSQVLWTDSRIIGVLRNFKLKLLMNTVFWLSFRKISSANGLYIYHYLW